MFLEFLLWLRGLRTKNSVHEDAGLIHDLTQWFKDLALPQLQHRSQMQLAPSVAVVVA